MSARLSSPCISDFFKMCRAHGGHTFLFSIVTGCLWKRNMPCGGSIAHISHIVFIHSGCIAQCRSAPITIDLLPSVLHIQQYFTWGGGVKGAPAGTGGVVAGSSNLGDGGIGVILGAVSLGYSRSHGERFISASSFLSSYTPGLPEPSCGHIQCCVSMTFKSA